METSAHTGSNRDAPIVVGRFAAQPLARELALECLRLGRRYVIEVVAAYRLCPFLKDPDAGFGKFIVVADDAPEARAMAEVVAASSSSIVHLVFPLVTMAASPFERFASSIGRELKQLLPKAPVSATFHPELAGATDDPHRLIGLLRRAPDPFVQYLPEGLQGGGTAFDGTTSDAVIDHPRERFERLRGDELARVLERLAEIRADRARAYARFEGAFTLRGSR